MLQSSKKIDAAETFVVDSTPPTSVFIYTSTEDLNRLSDLAQPLLKGRDTLDPRFFLASVSPNTWIPRVVAITRGESIVGVVYAKERKIAGILTGVIRIDTTLDNILADVSMSAECVFEKAIGRLLAGPGVRGVRLLIPPGSAQQRAIQTAVASRPFDVSYAKIEYHDLLRLSPTFELFLERLGPRTRRNFRYYRRRFEAAGGQHVDDMTFADFRAAAFRLVAKNVRGADLDGLNRTLNMLSMVKRPLLTGLRRDGEWVGVLGGWYQSDQATVYFQLNNDRDHPRDSLSVVLRAYAIESLSRKNIRRVLFWGRVGPPLSRHTEPVPAICAYVDTRGFWWRALRRILGRMKALLPAAARRNVGWIVPSGCDVP